MMKELLNLRFYEDKDVLCFFVHLLASALDEDGVSGGVEVNRGSFVTSLPELERQLKLTNKQVRGRLAKLVREQEIAETGQTNGSYRGRLITVLNYDKYINTTTKRADKGQTKGRQRADKDSNNTLKKSDFINWRPFFDAYPENKKGGTDAAAWKAAKSEGLNDSDFKLMLDDVKKRTELCSSWYSKYATGITKYIHERIWLTPVIPDISNVSRINPNYDDLFNKEREIEGIVINESR